MILLMAVVLVAEEVFAVLTPGPDVSVGNEDKGMGGECCAEAVKGPDEGDSWIILTARSSDTNVCALLLPVLLSVFLTTLCSPFATIMPLCCGI
jgi:hypothetical protein